MRAREEIKYIAFRALFILILIILILAFFDDVGANGNREAIARRTARPSLANVLHNESLFLPLVYGGASPSPTPSPTPKPLPTPAPTPTKTPVPGDLWCWVARAGNLGDETLIYAVVPGYCCELVGMKSGKTVYVQAVCDGTCDLFEAPEVIPPPFAWGDLEKLYYEANSQQVCSIQWPFNCRDTE